MCVKKNDIFYCIKDVYNMEAQSIKGCVYYVDTIYLLRSNNKIAEFYLRGFHKDENVGKKRFKILCDDGQPIDRFYEYFISEEEYIRNEKIDKLIDEK